MKMNVFLVAGVKMFLSHLLSGFWRRRLRRFALTSLSAVRVTTPGCGRKFIIVNLPSSPRLFSRHCQPWRICGQLYPQFFQGLNFQSFTTTQIGIIIFKLAHSSSLPPMSVCQCCTLMCPCRPSCSSALIVRSYYCQYLHPSLGPSMSCQPEH